MKKLIFVETIEIAKNIKKFIPEEFKLIPIEELLNIEELSIIQPNNLPEKIQVTKKIVSDSDSIYFVINGSREEEHILLGAILDIFEISRFYRIDIEIFEFEAIQKAFDNMYEIKQKEIDFIIAKYKIDMIVNKEMTNVLIWYFKKEGLINSEEAAGLKISRLILYALSVIVSNQDKIDNFIPEELQRVGVSYKIDGIDFRVRNNKKFRNDMEEQLISLLNIARDPSNQNFIKKFEQEPCGATPPKPLTKIGIQKICSYQFSYDPKEIMEICNKLHSGIEINNEKVSLITSSQTNSYFISSNKLEQINSFILKHYGKELLFDGVRQFTNSNKEQPNEKEAIVPNFYTDEFMPENLKNFLTDDEFKIYSFIFYRAIATQMKNLIISRTDIIVKILDEDFRLIAEKIEIPGWYTVGSFWEDGYKIKGENVELPNTLYVGQEISEYKLNASVFPVMEKTPDRYGTGRFIEKVNKEIVVEDSEITLLLDNLKRNNLIKIIANMIEPMSLGSQIYYFFLNELPKLIESDFIKDTNMKLQKIKEGKFKSSILIDEYFTLLEILKKNVGLQSAKNAPESWMIEKAKRIAKEQKQTLSDTILNNKALLLKYISESEINEKIGICPDCKNGEIFEKEKGFFCNNEKCRFVFWKDTASKFFEHYEKEVNQNLIKNYLKYILEKGKCYVTNLYSPKKQIAFSSDIVLKYNVPFQKWEFSLSIDKEGVNHIQKPILETTKEQKEIIPTTEKEIPNESQSFKETTPQENKPKNKYDVQDLISFNSHMNHYLHVDNNIKLMFALFTIDKINVLMESKNFEIVELFNNSILKIFRETFKDFEFQLFELSENVFLSFVIYEEEGNVTKAFNDFKNNTNANSIMYQNNNLKISTSVGLTKNIFGNDTKETILNRLFQALEAAALVGNKIIIK